jgi:NosR/NirI family nitrous oxide reductase transcriptional regulator
MQDSQIKKRTSYLATVPPQEILPIVNSRSESSVPGIFVIGDVTGLPLVKIAANQGAEVISKLAEEGRFENTQTASQQLDLVILGAGPAGLAAAVEAQQRGLKYVVLERNKVASTVRSFPPGKMVYAEPRFIANTSGLDTNEDLDKDTFLQRIDQLVHEQGLHIKEGTEVTTVQKLGPQRFEVQTKSGKSFPTRYVLVAIGRQGQPRLLECPGADRADKVTYRMHSPDDYQDQEILVVGGGNSAIEAALMLMQHNRVTLSYRGDHFYRAKEENRHLLEGARLLGREQGKGQLTVLTNSNVRAIHDSSLEIEVEGQLQTLPNDHVIVQIGSLPPIDFLRGLGLELDGLWTKKRFALALVGLGVGTLIYFFSKYFVLRVEGAGAGKLWLPGLQEIAHWVGPTFGGWQRAFGSWLPLLFHTVLPVLWLILLAVKLIHSNMLARGHTPRWRVPLINVWLIGGGLAYWLYEISPHVFTLDPAQAGPGPYYLPGFTWLYMIIPTYFTNLYGLYYLLYFTAIGVFGIFWAYRSGHWLVWRRNLILIATQWTLWWGIPTFLAVTMGRNAWTPLISRSLNAWPLNMGAFQLSPTVGSGDPAWWHTVAVVGVVWATLLTFVVIPLMTLRWGKIYCSYICSCGALAETVGNGFRHRGPKGDLPRKWERVGFVFIGLACLATIADLYGYQGPLGYYNFWIGTALAGAVAIGLYPFLGQRIWCRMWCPLAFWMNFWGRWSKFKITPEKGKCIDCNVCNQYCQMGIDIKSRALQGKPVTLIDSPCVACAECVVRCPMEILHLGEWEKS